MTTIEETIKIELESINEKLAEYDGLIARRIQLSNALAALNDERAGSSVKWGERHAWTESEIAEVKRQISKGLTVGSAAQVIGRTYSATQRMMVRNGLSARSIREAAAESGVL